MTFDEAVQAAGMESKSGKQAIKGEYRSKVSVTDGLHITGSVDIDEHFKDTEPQANRWDYAIGVKNVAHFVIWIEVHPASSTGDVDVVIRKLQWIQEKLKSKEFKGLAILNEKTGAMGYIQFHWLYSGRCKFKSGGKEASKLAQYGMELPKRMLLIG